METPPSSVTSQAAPLRDRWRPVGPLGGRLRRLLPLVLLLVAQPAGASLGGSLGSVEADRLAMAATARPLVSGSGYTVREVDSAGLELREYLSPAGVVFAVAWNGMGHPDLAQVLGSYAGEFQEAAASTPRHPGRRAHEVRTPRLVVQRWGHMRAYHGRAFDPTLVPPGVSLDAIR
jgi:hypothetical protein